jgi:hypothetical protein
MNVHERIDAWLDARTPPARREESWAAARAGWIPTIRLAWLNLIGHR